MKLQNLFVVLAAVSAATGANAAKLCVRNNADIYQGAYNLTNGKWVLGTDCGAQANGYTISKTGGEPDTWCAGVAVKGISACSNKSIGEYNSGTNPISSGEASGQNCYCRIIWPYDLGAWFYKSTYASNCAGSCAASCASVAGVVRLKVQLLGLSLAPKDPY